MKKSLKNFNPDKVAELEVYMWQTYYSHNFLKLFFLLIKLAHESFSVNYLLSIRIAYYLASASVDFRVNKGKENSQRILHKLEKAFKLISRNSMEVFDYKKVASLELNWWLVDRYSDRYKISRAEAISLAMSELYGVNHSLLKEYGEKRAEAMVVQDNLKDNSEWGKIGVLLNESYNSLYKNIN